MFTPEEKRELLAIARTAISDALHGRSSEVQIPPEGNLSRPGGAFVTSVPVKRNSTRCSIGVREASGCQEAVRRSSDNNPKEGVTCMGYL